MLANFKTEYLSEDAKKCVTFLCTTWMVSTLIVCLCVFGSIFVINQSTEQHRKNLVENGYEQVIDELNPKKILWKKYTTP